ncbi:MAG: hypothetical protein IT320_08375 [Anaerolineae bacterium]|nr:hypothetical protein [Anaerolineae bacterium]
MIERTHVTTLLGLFAETGLIQFGDFDAGDGRRRPFLTRFELLASYPDVLAACVDVAESAIRAGDYVRLLCDVSALPLGTALALRTGIPLVYSRGGQLAPVDDLVGAYDIGHKTLLIAGLLDGDPLAQPWVQGARRVGLETASALGILDARPVGLLSPADDHTAALLSLSEAVEAYAAQGIVPAGQAAAVRMWLSLQSTP